MRSPSESRGARKSQGSDNQKSESASAGKDASPKNVDAESDRDARKIRYYIDLISRMEGHQQVRRRSGSRSKDEMSTPPQQQSSANRGSASASSRRKSSPTPLASSGGKQTPNSIPSNSGGGISRKRLSTAGSDSVAASIAKMPKPRSASTAISPTLKADSGEGTVVVTPNGNRAKRLKRQSNDQLQVVVKAEDTKQSPTTAGASGANHPLRAAGDGSSRNGEERKRSRATQGATAENAAGKSAACSPVRKAKRDAEGAKNSSEASAAEDSRGDSRFFGRGGKRRRKNIVLDEEEGDNFPEESSPSLSARSANAEESTSAADGRLTTEEKDKSGCGHEEEDIQLRTPVAKPKGSSRGSGEATGPGGGESRGSGGASVSPMVVGEHKSQREGVSATAADTMPGIDVAPTKEAPDVLRQQRGLAATTKSSDGGDPKYREGRQSGRRPRGRLVADDRSGGRGGTEDRGAGGAGVSNVSPASKKADPLESAADATSSGGSKHFKQQVHSDQTSSSSSGSAGVTKMTSGSRGDRRNGCEGDAGSGICVTAADGNLLARSSAVDNRVGESGRRVVGSRRPAASVGLVNRKVKVRVACEKAPEVGGSKRKDGDAQTEVKASGDIKECKGEPAVPIKVDPEGGENGVAAAKQESSGCGKRAATVGEIVREGDGGRRRARGGNHHADIVKSEGESDDAPPEADSRNLETANVSRDKASVSDGTARSVELKSGTNSPAERPPAATRRRRMGAAALSWRSGPESGELTSAPKKAEAAVEGKCEGDGSDKAQAATSRGDGFGTSRSSGEGKEEIQPSSCALRGKAVEELKRRADGRVSGGEEGERQGSDAAKHKKSSMRGTSDPFEPHAGTGPENLDKVFANAESCLLRESSGWSQALRTLTHLLQPESTAPRMTDDHSSAPSASSSSRRSSLTDFGGENPYRCDWKKRLIARCFSPRSAAPS